MVEAQLARRVSPSWAAVSGSALRRHRGGLCADERAGLDALATRVGVAGDRYGAVHIKMVGR
ncbi:hypothetical protein [Microbispora siamensis]|uniref:Uncharacterized protein n=1 Tax=Microbispora siamensis TaxID=564413 RepID=A0ABQ4GN85_9ACTN|nr:hypothetical protein [Microbispora siamensis]GIH62834.1 hypothetical protein Msi02_36510 [Microbispora siamensis]